MRCRPLFFASSLSLLLCPCPAMESRQSGEWTDFSTFENTLELKADGESAARGGFSYKGLIIDRRSSLKENAATGGLELTFPHNDSFYFGAGPIRFSGLPHTLSDPFGKRLHSGSRYRPASFSLDAGASATKMPQAVLSLGTSRRQPYWIQAAAIADSAERTSGVAGFGVGVGGHLEARLEAFLGAANLSERESGTWFSDEPPLPVRRQLLRALSLTSNIGDTQWFFCGAYSETEAQGSGAYLKTSGDVAAGPFRIIVASDTATPLFVDGNGDAIGERYRALVNVRHSRKSGGELSLGGEIESETALAYPTAMRAEAKLRFPLRAEGSSLRPFELTGEAERTRSPENEGLNRVKLETRLGTGRIRTELQASMAVDDRSVRQEILFAGKATMPLGGARLSVSAGTQVDERGKPSWRAGLGAAMALLGGLVKFDLSTDSPDSWERLTGQAPTASPLGPWTLSLSWIFRQRFQSRPFGVE